MNGEAFYLLKDYELKMKINLMKNWLNTSEELLKNYNFFEI
jgi:hypothetical protein